MLDALQSDAIRVYYQPIVSLEDGKIAGAEALAAGSSWMALFIAGYFIPLAEQTG